MRRTFLAAALVAPWLVVGGLAEAAGGIADPARVIAPEPLALPAVGAPFEDPAFGTTITRVSGTSATGVFATQVYSQLQAFSADEAYMLLTGPEGYMVRRVADLEAVTGFDASGWNAPRWNPAHPHVVLHFDSNEDATVRLQHTDVENGTTWTVFTFPDRYQYVRVGQSFDEGSQDGRWVAGLLTRDDGASVLFALDLEAGRLGAEIPVGDLFSAGGPCRPDPEWGALEPDWIGMSPLGRHLVVQWARDGTARCSGLETFEPATGEFHGRAYDGHQHGDLGVDTDGTEFFMTLQLASPEDGNRPGLATYALPGTDTVGPARHVRTIDWTYNFHVSCLGPRGVGLVSSGSTIDGGPRRPFDGELFLAYTNGDVLRLAHHRSSQCGYWVQPRATLSAEGQYVLFASDWAQGADRTSCQRWDADFGVGDPYLITLEGSLPAVPRERTASAASDDRAPTPGAPPGADADEGSPAGAQDAPVPSPGVSTGLLLVALAAGARRRGRAGGGK